MRCAYAVLALLLAGAPLPAQQRIAAGTVLPLRLETTLKAEQVKPGKEVRAEVMQNIPGTKIHRGAHVIGHVVSATPTSLSLRFDTLIFRGERIPLKTNLRAIASMMEVDWAQQPESGPDRGLPPEDWTTQQVGGEQVYRGGGPVTSGLEVVGEPTPNGVRGRVRSKAPCRGAVDGNGGLQAFWIFSTNACGAYGFDGLSIRNTGRNSPHGTIDLVSQRGKLLIRSGSGLLLRVKSS